MKIAFYLENKNLSNIDCSNIENGNPGIGGTEYIIQATIYYLTKLAPQYHIVLGAQCIDNIPPIPYYKKTDNISELIKDEKPDYIIFKYEPYLYKEASICAKESNTKLIPWAHNFIKRSELTTLANNPLVTRIICVSKEQLNMYRDHKAFLKSVYIYNGMPVEYLKTQLPYIPSYNKRPFEVTYIGSIVPYKGFHILAEAWKDILKVFPQAKLNVIGSGKLYDRTSKLGRYGIAEEEYEKQFMPALTDDAGNIIPSVHFWGVLGTEKNEILKRTRVGVPNPSGISETFCITALEMQAMGALVTTINYGGLKNTVFHTGLLYNNPKDLATSIVTLLKKKDNHIQDFYEFMEENFSFEHITKDWIDFINHLSDSSIPFLPNNNSDYASKLKEFNRKIKRNIPFGYTILPTIDFYQSILRHLHLIK